MASKVTGIIEKININGTNNAIASTAYGYCETAAGTKIKDVDMTGFILYEGVTVHIKFANANTASEPQLRINSNLADDAKSIVQYGTTAVGITSETNGWYAGAVISFTYDGERWIRDQGFNTNTNDTAGYIRHFQNGSYVKPTTKMGRYVLLLDKGDGIHVVPIHQTQGATNEEQKVNTKSNITAEEFDIFGPIEYYNATSDIAAEGNIDGRYHWAMHSDVDLQYSFNIGATLTAYKDVYLVASLQTSSTAVLRNPGATGDNAKATATGSGAGPITQTLPTTEDGFIYIKLGHAYSTSAITLTLDHPIYYYKNGELRHYYGYSIAASKAAITSTANAVAYFSDTIGTFASKASADGALYATSNNGSLLWGTLPVPQGGTGIKTSTTVNAVLIGSSTTATDAFQTVATASGAFYATAANAKPSFGVLPVAQGGTNATSVTKYGIAIGNSSEDGYTFTTAGSDGYILIGKGTNASPAWQEILPIGHGGTGTKTAPTQYGVIYASSTTAYASTGAGTANQILISGGTAAPSWTTSAFLASAVGSVANTEAWTTLTLGNNQPTNTASNSHSRGEITIYSEGTTYTSIRAQDGYSKIFYLPKYDGDMYAAHVATSNTAVGSNTSGSVQPVYVEAGGRISAITNPLAISYGGTGLSTTSPHYVFIGPSTGTTAEAPSWRALVVDDLPTIPVGGGGTNITSYTIGDILYASGTTTLSTLTGNVTTTRKFLCSVATNSGTAVAPAWDTVTKTDVGLSNVTNDKQLPIAGGTMTGAITTKGIKGTTAIDYGEVLPNNGTEGRIFFQISDAWYEIPSGGTTGQALVKRSNSDRDVVWASPSGGGVLTPDNINKYYVAGSTSAAENTNPAVFNTSVYVENSVLFGAAWNDYAEYRECTDIVEPGRCIIENGDGTLSLSNRRLQAGAEIVSDTFGFAIGKTGKCGTPIAVSGRVLAYTDRPRECFKVGMPVCSGPKGTISQMTKYEAQKYPWLIIGTVSSIPTEEEWSGKKINNRIWIRVR